MLHQWWLIITLITTDIVSRLLRYLQSNARLRIFYWSQSPREIRRVSAASCSLGLRVRIPLRARMSVYFECCVLSGRCPCDGAITLSEESFRVWSLILDSEETLATKSCWVIKKYIMSFCIYIHCSVHHCNCSKIITNKMTLMDYPLFHG